MAVGNRGKYAEGKLKSAFDALVSKHRELDYERLPDARSGKGAGKVKIADFQWFTQGKHGAIDVKELDHPYRLPSKNLTQLPKMQRRVWAGGTCAIIVYHAPTKKWRVVSFCWLQAHKDQPSYDLREFYEFDSCKEALETYLRIAGVLV